MILITYICGMNSKTMGHLLTMIESLNNPSMN